jgi:uncharacterized protein (UPF0332 family)
MTQEVLDLWQRARKAVQTAGKDLQDDPDAAASRAYYTAFYAVSAWLALRGESYSRHSAVEAAVHRDLVKAGLWPPERGADYSFLRALRMQGDYGGSVHVDVGQAQQAVEAAQGILAAVHALHPDVFGVD